MTNISKPKINWRIVNERTKELQQQTELPARPTIIFYFERTQAEITSQLNRESIMSTLYHHVIRLMPAEAFRTGSISPGTTASIFPATSTNGKVRSFYQRDMQ